MTRSRYRGLMIPALVLVAIMALTGCGDDKKPEVKLTPIPDLLSGNVEDAAEVTIQGTVTDLSQLPLRERDSYELTEGGQTVAIVTELELPVLGEEVRSQGSVQRGFTIREVEFGTVVMEQERPDIGGAEPEDSSIPLWVWIAGGAVLVILLLVLLLVFGRKEKGSSATCPHCDAPVEADWVVCTECGGDLDAPPAMPGTIIQPPAEPPPPNEDELRNRERQRSATILIPPESGDDDF